MPRIIAISNQKGGVGKTTTATNLAAALARAGHPTLLVDADPQGNATSALGVSRGEVEHGVADAILGLAPVAACVVGTQQEKLDLVPATSSLVGVEVELVGLANRERRLAIALADLPRAYDFVLIDCPPSLGLLTLNALVAADGVLIPLQAEYHAMEGLGELVRTVTAVRRGPNPRLVREGIVITMSDSRTNLCREVERQAREVFGPEVFEAVVPRAVRLAEAPSYGRTIFTHDPSSRAAQAYTALAREVVRRAIGGAGRREVAS
ncbi:MAG: ParA family protein [Myxococcota bacterium]